jgi:hypothetical protein
MGKITQCSSMVFNMELVALVLSRANNELNASVILQVELTLSLDFFLDFIKRP